MTKRRAALTYELALTKVAGLIGWPRTAEIVGQAERTVRNWSDPDCSPNIRLDAAEKLDIAFAEAGGRGSPFGEVYHTRLKTSLANSFGSAEAIAEAAAVSAKEGGESVAAAIAAARPDAGDADYAAAERELEESIAADTATLSAIRRRREAERELEDRT